MLSYGFELQSNSNMSELSETTEGWMLYLVFGNVKPHQKSQYNNWLVK